MSRLNGRFVGNNLGMDKIAFPTSNGVVIHSGNKKVISAINCEGQKKLQSYPEKNKVIFWHFPFVRGLQYFICGIYGFLSALILACDICGGKKVKQADLKKHYTKKLIYFALTLLGAIIFSAVGLGLLPGKLGILIVGYRGSEILRNCVIMSIKIAFFYVFLLFFRIFPVINDLFRFNRASDVALFCGDVSREKRKHCPARALNFLNYLVFVFILDFIVVTLVGASFGFWFNILFHICIFALCMSVGFEILNLIDLCKWKVVKNLAYLTACLVYAKPTTTHIETVTIALTEINLLINQKGREFMAEDNHAFSVVYNEVKNKLSNAGINEKSETDWLIATVLGKNRAEIKLVSTVTDKQYQDIMKATSRRSKGESLDNIFGFTEFYGIRFDVNKRVLTPRMETEILVEQVLKVAKNFKRPQILDLGTGSGAIAVAVAKNCDCEMTAIDVSKNALTVAESNAKKNDTKIEFLHSNLFENLKRKRKFDIIVSNPPYIASGDIKKLDKNVRECDPLLALDGGQDGLDYYRSIIPSSTKRLRSGGTLLLEIGKGQGAQVRKLMRENGFEEIKTIKDYNKIERVICGKFK